MACPARPVTRPKTPPTRSVTTTMSPPRTACWAAAQAFYREGRYRPLGYPDLEDYLARAWEPSYRRRHPADLLCMLRTWIRSDVSRKHGGDLPAALGSIQASVLVMPSA